MTKFMVALLRFSLLILVLLVVSVTHGVGSVSAESPTRASVSVAEYRITFDATWTAATHPIDFPSSDHWSALVGTTHNSNLTLWETGQLATPGMKNVAEFGSNGSLKGEVDSAIAMQTAHQWIQTGFAPFTGDADATIEITTTSDFPLLSLATMVAPSPDWFSGVNSLSLIDGKGLWKSSIVMDVYPYDAGTDSGTTYRSDDNPTMPFVAIAPLTGVAPFSSAPVGTLTVTLLNTPTSVGLANVDVGSNHATPIIVVAMLGLLILTAVRSGAGIPRRVG